MFFDSFFEKNGFKSLEQKLLNAGADGKVSLLSPKKRPSNQFWDSQNASKFFASLSYAETLFVKYAAAFPEIFGQSACNAALRFFAAQKSASDLNAENYENTIKEHIALLKDLYGAAKKIDKKTKSCQASLFAENYERFADTALDKRFEAAALERIKDGFYEDSRLCVAEPDWIKTSQKELNICEMPPFSDIFSASETEIKTLGDILILCAFRDGAFPLFCPDDWGISDDGKIILKKCSAFVILTDLQRKSLNAFTQAVVCENYAEAAKILFTTGMLPPLFPLSELSKILKSCLSCDDTPLQKANRVFSALYENGILPLPSFFLLRQSLNVFNAFAERFTNHPWESAEEDFKEWIKIEPLKTDVSSPSDFLNEGMKAPENFALTRRVQRKKDKSFINDRKKIPEMIKQGEAGYRFRKRSSGIGARIIVPLLALLFLVIAVVLF